MCRKIRCDREFLKVFGFLWELNKALHQYATLFKCEHGYFEEIPHEPLATMSSLYSILVSFL